MFSVALPCKQCKQVLFTERECFLGYCHRHSDQHIANGLAFEKIRATHRAEGRMRLAKFQIRQFQETTMFGESPRFVWWIEKGLLCWTRNTYPN